MASLQEREPGVLFVDLSLEFGEDQQLVMEDIRELHDRGLNWRVICRRDSSFYEQVNSFGKDRVIALDVPPRHNLDRDFRDLIRSQLTAPLNLIHIFGSEYLGSILPWMLQVPEVPIVVSEGPRVDKKWRHLFQSFFYPRIDAMIVPSLAIRKRIQIMRPSLRNKIRVVHPGLDFNVFNPEHFDFNILRKKWEIEPDFYIVGMIANPEYKKAQSAFIKAAASFLRNEELAARTKFVIIGFEHEGNEDLIELIRLFHLEKQIILAPAEDSVPKVLGSLDVYIIPSSKAMFGLLAIKALAMATPIICASGSDSIEWIGNSQGGLLMRSGDSFDLQRQLRMMLEDPEQLKVMGKRAVQYVRENYDRKTRTDELMETYQRVLKRRAQ